MQFLCAGTFEYMNVHTIKFSEQSALHWDGRLLGLFRPFLRKCPEDRKALMEAGALYRVKGVEGRGVQSLFVSYSIGMKLMFTLYFFAQSDMFYKKELRLEISCSNICCGQMGVNRRCHGPSTCNTHICI